MSGRQTLRCAIYTRKSSEEGLDQEFNSLDAQREACAAFIASQVGLGWKLVANQYDDGGISGGTMERPALQRLLQDIRDRKVDVVVVYKIDRLTRSLMDFSKIVEVFDASNVSFVSVTQQFNTTTSMGRLTLNVLLSFAQFEREVTAERIRDKIAASKKKGMWMGGHVPLGYQVVDRKLLIHDAEAETVRHLFKRYLEVRSVLLLSEEINSQIARDCRGTDDQPLPRQSRRFTRGKLYYLLSNQVFIGKLRHHQRYFDGEHKPIIDCQTFADVQSLLVNQAQRRRGTSDTADTHLLTGILFDEAGDRLSPTHATKGGKRYRYYISNRLKVARSKDDGGWRVPATEIERLVDAEFKALLADEATITDWVCSIRSPANVMPVLSVARQLCGDAADRLQLRIGLLSTAFARIVLSSESISFEVKPATLIDQLLQPGGIEHCAKEQPIGSGAQSDGATITIHRQLTIKRRGVEARLVIEGASRHDREPDQTLVDLIARAHFYLERLTSGGADSIAELAGKIGVHRADISRLLPLAFLSPSILDAILSGRQPANLSARALTRLVDIPPAWSDQAHALGIQ
ncbi:DNA-invertase hin [Aminobacter sp. MSH1]|uniref:recombinase family protein n=1 Tax=Aminobacter sp. MSH1 TaxID=374606 RepID=UPI000D366FB1|nr:recombinase family protein [Aminobacter sp. MSH1]AWC21317.1 DNA-invertase hin [Aminobacter sp. MSH1]